MKVIARILSLLIFAVGAGCTVPSQTHKVPSAGEIYVPVGGGLTPIDPRSCQNGPNNCFGVKVDASAPISSVTVPENGDYATIVTPDVFIAEQGHAFPAEADQPTGTQPVTTNVPDPQVGDVSAPRACYWLGDDGNSPRCFS